MIKAKAKTELDVVIHPSVVIDSSAIIGKNVTIGPASVIGPNVEIGDDTYIGPHVVVDRNTKVGRGNKIYSFASVGGDPQDLGYRGEDTYLEIGDYNIIREGVTLNRGSVGGSGTTQIGNHNLFLAYSHVAHDCVIGNRILMVNNAVMAGHVTIHDYVILGAFTAIHQYCTIGAYTFLSRAAEVSQDIPPYMLVKGIPGLPCGLNLVGLKRHGFSEDTINVLKRAYKLIYRRHLKLTEVIEQLSGMVEATPEIQLILDAIQNSARSIARRSYEEDRFSSRSDD